jgi:ribosomal subunit interface protein
LTPALSEHVNKKLEKIAKSLDNDTSVQCDVELGKISAHHQKGDIFKAEIHIVGSGKNIYASIEKADLFSAIDIVRDEVLRELRSGKGKKISLVRRSGLRLKNMLKGIWSWRDKGEDNIQ